VSSRSRLASLAAIAALAALLCLPALAQASFGIKEFSAVATDKNGLVELRAGSHPYEYTISFEMNQDAAGNPEGKLRSLIVDLPAGLVGNPLAVPRCSGQEFEGSPPHCLANTQVGVVVGRIKGVGTAFFRLFNLVPPPGAPASFGFSLTEVGSIQRASVREGDFGVSVSDITVPTTVDLQAADVTIWGVPADPGHDGDRGECLQTAETCPAGLVPRPFITLPANCDAPLKTTFFVDSLEEPGDFLTRSGFESKSFLSLNESGEISPQHGCESVPFAPKVAVLPTSKLAESGSGLDFELRLPNIAQESPGGIAETQPKKLELTLPEGVTVNPSAAEGVGVCSPQQYAAEKIDSKPGQGCPQASKLGSAIAHTPVLEEPIEGSLYLAKPYDNPSGSLIGLYIVLRAVERGVIIKLDGNVVPDPRTGQLVSTFDDLPPLPYTDFTLHFREGGRAPLVTPPSCGGYESKARLYPFSAPTQPRTVSAFFQVTQGVSGGACPPGGVLPFKPEFSAGSLNNNAKSYSPFHMRLIRHDGEQDMTKFSSILPPGVLGKLAGVSQCPDAVVAIAKAKTGTEELASPSCPPNSQIGRTMAGAGVGSVLTYVPGALYLGGPYNGAPLSVIAITSAVAGPFDVGTVVVREALTLNPVTAEVEVDGAASDPIPHILAGIPLKVRDLRVYVDRENFIVNPTSCDPSSAKATLFGGFLDVFSPADDVPVGLSDRYQAANCLNLGFKPNLKLNLRGGTRRGDHPGLKAVLRARPGDANIASAQVTLPRSAFLDQGHLDTICTRVQYAAEQCPKGSIYGHAKAITPLLDESIEGPVYLRSSNHHLPDLVIGLKGIVDVDVASRIDSFKGGIRSSFEVVPDAPVSEFILTLKGGRKGLIVNSRDLCKGRISRVTARFRGQNGRARVLRPRLQPRCGGGG
jgi:hypothetical protein